MALRKSLPVIAVMLALLLCGCAAEHVKKIPVILDTDIGSDFDDMWALAMLLNSPELDVKLITVSTGDTISRARLTAKVLDIAGRTDIPIGIGSGNADGNVNFRQSRWIEDYEMSRYPGVVYPDGVKAMTETILQSKEKITVIAVGPLPTVGAALEQAPEIAGNAVFVGMHGSIRDGKAEYNVQRWVDGMRKVVAAEWPKTITPLDTCGTVILDGERYQTLLRRHSPLTDALIEAYRQWYAAQNWIDPGQIHPDKTSSILYDTVAVYLAIDTDFVTMETLPLSVTDKGKTVIDKEHGHTVQVATEWKDQEAFKDFLLERIIK